jgi:hypothetical protein
LDDFLVEITLDSKKPVKPRLKKKEEPQMAVYVEELTEDPYF